MPAAQHEFSALASFGLLAEPRRDPRRRGLDRLTRRVEDWNRPSRISAQPRPPTFPNHLRPMVKNHLRQPLRVGVMETLPRREDDEVPDALVGVRRVIPRPEAFNALEVGAIDQADSDTVQKISTWTREDLAQRPVGRQEQVFATAFVFQRALNPCCACPLPPAAIGVGGNPLLIEVVTAQSQPSNKRGSLA